MPILFALIAILLWAGLASLASLLRGLPPFLLLSAALFIGGLPGIFNLKAAFSNRRAIVIGVVGYTFYHFFLFQGYRLAPPLHVNVVNYLWPSLIVFLGPVFDRTLRLSKRNIFGLVLGFVGVAYLVLGGDEGESSGDYPKLWLGYSLGLCAALSWPIYTWLTRKMGDGTSTWNVSAICLCSSLLTFFLHLLFEDSFPLQQLASSEILYLVLMGLGPFGAAFYAWDYSVKRGDPKTIGALSYLTPVLSNLGLVFTLGAPLTPRLGVAVISVFLGAILASQKIRSTPVNNN